MPGPYSGIALVTQYQAAIDTTTPSAGGFQGRCVVAASNIALQIIVGGVGGSSDAQVRYAYLVLANPQFYVAQQIAFAAVADGVTTVGSTDTVISARILALWPDLAGP